MMHRKFYQDEGGVFRPDLREEALVAFQAMAADGGTEWKSLGPAAGVLTGGDFTLPISGLVADIAAPDVDNVWFGTRWSGVWSTVDGGTTWTPLGDSLPSLQTTAVAISPSRSVLYCAMGDLDDGRLIRTAGLSGLFRSVDGGMTWFAADSGPGGTRFRSVDVNQIVAIDDDRVLVATRVGLFFSTDGGRNFGGDALHRDGLALLNGQATSIVVDGSEVLAVISSVGSLLSNLGVGVPSDLADRTPPPLGLDAPGLYHATLAANAISAFTPLRTPADGGPGPPEDGTSKVAWQHTAAGNIAVYSIGGAIRLSDFDPLLSESTSEIIRAVHAANVDPTLAAKWKKVSIGSAFTSDFNEQPRAMYMHAVALEPPASAGSAQLWINTLKMRRQALTRSPSGNWSWSPGSARVEAGAVHSDHHAVRVVQSGADRFVLVGSDGGFYRRKNTGAFEARNTHVTALFYQVAAAADGAGGLRVLGGLQDNHTVIGDGPVDPAAGAWTWRFATREGDGGTAAFVPNLPADLRPTNPSAALASVNGLPLLSRATAAATGPWAQTRLETADPRAIFSELAVVARGGLPAAEGSWTRVYFSFALTRDGETGGVLQRADGFAPPAAPAAVPLPAWTRCPASSRGAVPSMSFPTMITALVASPKPTEEALTNKAWPVLWVGLADGKLLRSEDAGETFQEMFSGGIRRPITGIAVDPADARVVAVCTAGFARPAIGGKGARVFLTTDFGSSFVDISGTDATSGLPDLPMFGISFARTQPRTLVGVNDAGVVTAIALANSDAATPPTFDGSWRRLGTGLPALTCMGLSVVDLDADVVIDRAQPNAAAKLLRPVVIGTLGRGAWVLAASTRVVGEGSGGFGPARVGVTIDRTLILRNLGAAAAGLAVPDPPAPFTWVGLAGPAPYAVNVPAGGTASLTVRFTPALGISSGSVVIPGGPTFFLSGEGVADGPPRLALSRRVVPFGWVAQGTVATTTIAVRNGGLSPLTLVLPAIAAPFEVVLPKLVLAPGEQISATIRFSPTSAPGTAHETRVDLGCDDPTVAADPGHFRLVLSGTSGQPLPAPPPPPAVPAPAAGGTPGWVPWVIAGAAIAGIGIGIGIGIAIANANKQPPPAGP